MASYRGHLTFSSALGAAYGAWATFDWEMDWGPVLLGSGLTALGGLLPDLDSDSSVPFREVFGLAAAVTPLLLIHRIAHLGFSPEQTLVVTGGIYVFIRYGLRAVFKKLTVHRGMFHSIPAMLIAGLTIFLLYHGAPENRLFLSAGVMIGFLSHLVLDQLYGIDLMGGRLSAGSGGPLKFISASWSATMFTYFLLVVLGFLAYIDLSGKKSDVWHSSQELVQSWVRQLRQ
jgi:LexA-binding, inner membrane-associated putative hydrolase